MTPQEIFEYKQSWKNRAFEVPFHSDYDWRAKDWCRRNLQRHQWSMTSWTGAYEHTMLFEHLHHAQNFEMDMQNAIIE